MVEIYRVWLGFFLFWEVIVAKVEEDYYKDRKKEEKEWEIKGAVDTLLKAAEIKKDKKLMADVKKEVAKKQGNLSEILRNTALSITSDKQKEE